MNLIENSSPLQLLEIGKWERLLMWSVLASGAFAILFVIIDRPLSWFASVPFVCVQLFCIYKFAETAGVGWQKWLILGMFFVPLLGWIGLVVLVVRINSLFKKRGIRIGIMGPKRDLEAYIPLGKV